MSDQAVWVVQTYIEPLAADECPVYVFTNLPTKSTVWSKLSELSMIKDNEITEDGYQDGWSYASSYLEVIE